MTRVTTLELDDGFLADPHALYRVLREERPVTRAVTPLGMRVWLVTRFADAREALGDARLSKNGARFGELMDRHLTVAPENRAQFADSLAGHMLNSDPPDHTRLRKLVNRAFTVRAIAGMRPRIEEIAGALADDMSARAATGDGTVDLLDTFAFPLAMTVICELLGVPDGERDAFREWSNTVFSSGPPEQRTAAAAAMAQFLAALVADKSADPGDDMLSAIVSAGIGGSGDGADRLSPREATSMAFLLLVAGHETTVNLIGNGSLALLSRPGTRAELLAEPGLVPAAVEEFLRFDGPVNLATLRYTTEPVTIAGTEIPEGEFVMVSLTAANRDGRRYPQPDDLDLHRDTSQHVAFGYGIHHCLGAPLARLEAEIAFRTLLARFPGMVLAAEPGQLTWRSSTLIRGLTRLPVRLWAERPNS